MKIDPEIKHVVVDLGCLPDNDKHKYNEKRSGEHGLLYLISDTRAMFRGAIEFWLADAKPDKINICAGQDYAERLEDAQGVIPSEWRDFCLVFAGTRWMGKDVTNGDICVLVPVLVWNSAFKEWGLYFWRLDTIIHAAPKDKRFKFVCCAVHLYL